MFKHGDIVELIDNNGMSAPKGALAKVINHYAGTYVEVDWIGSVGDQMGGAYCPDRFRRKEEKTMKAGDIVTVEGIVKAVVNDDLTIVTIDNIEIVINNKSIKSVTPTYNVGDRVYTKNGYEGTVLAVSPDHKNVWIDYGDDDYGTQPVEAIEKKLD